MPQHIVNFRESRIWLSAHKLVMETYRLTASYPHSEERSIKVQMRSAAITVSSKISRLFAQPPIDDFIKTLDIIRDALCDYNAHMSISLELGYLDEAQIEELDEYIHDFKDKLNTLITALN